MKKIKKKKNFINFNHFSFFLFCLIYKYLAIIYQLKYFYHEILRTHRTLMWLAFLQPKPNDIMLVLCKQNN